MRIGPVLLILLGLSCSRRDLALFNPDTYFPKEIKSEAPKPFTNDSPENVLENVKISYNTRNYGLYQSLLASDYRFYMDSTLLGTFNAKGTQPDPALWTLEVAADPMGIEHIGYYKTVAQDLNSVRKMFDPVSGAQDISLSFHASPGDTLSPDTVKFNVQNIEMTLTVRGSLIPYTVSDNINYKITEVWLVKSADALWRIWRWYDNTDGAGDQYE